MRDKELRKKDEGFVDSYPQWLENRVREVKLSKKTNGERVEIDVPIKVEEVRELKAELQKSMGTKEKLKGVVIRVRKQCNRLRDVNMSTTETLEREIRRAKGEETNKMDNYMDEFSDELQEYILNIVDVQVNEKCGSRVIAVALGQGQEFGFLFTKI